MSFEDIKIVRQFNVVDGFIQFQDNLEEDKSKYAVEDVLNAYSCLEIGKLTAGSGSNKTAGGKGLQTWIELPEYGLDERATICDPDAVSDLTTDLAEDLG